MAGYSWMVPESRLDTEQRAALLLTRTSEAKNIWIQGFAGSGKTILLIHAMREIRRSRPTAEVGIVVFTRALVNLLRTGLGDQNRDVPVMTYEAFKKEPRRFDVILVDEVQDLPLDVLKLLCSFSKRMIVAGDDAQSIFRDRVSPDEIRSVLEPLTVVKLSIIHRITRTIYDLAKEFGEIIPPKDQIEIDVSVPLWKCGDPSEEAAFVWHHTGEVAEQGVPTAVLFPNNEVICSFSNHVLTANGKRPWTICRNRFNGPAYDSLNAHLGDCGLKLQYVGGQYGDLENLEDGVVRMMSYFSAKGLDFNTVFLPCLTRNLEIWRDDESLARRIIFVALTRSRQNLNLSYWGPPPAHRFVEEIRPLLIEKDRCGSSRREAVNVADMPF